MHNKKIIPFEQREMGWKELLHEFKKFGKRPKTPPKDTSSSIVEFKPAPRQK